MFNQNKNQSIEDNSNFIIVELSRSDLNLEDQRMIDDFSLWIKRNGLEDPEATDSKLIELLIRTTTILDHFRHFETWRFLMPSYLKVFNRLEQRQIENREITDILSETSDILISVEWAQRLVDFEPVLGEQFPSWVKLDDRHPMFLPRRAEMVRAKKESSVNISRKAPITAVIIGLNILVFLLVNFRPDSRYLMNTWGLSSALWLDGRAINQGYCLSLLSHMFLHQGWFHLLANMITLGFVGPPIEVVIGRWRFIGLYFTAGIVGGISHLIIFPGPAIFSDLNQFLNLVNYSPSNLNYYYPAAIGASGAISGVLAAIVIVYPHALLYLFGFIRLTVPQFAWGFVVLHIVMLITSVLFPDSIFKVVAWHSHLAGFMIGYLWIKCFYQKPNIALS